MFDPVSPEPSAVNGERRLLNGIYDETNSIHLNCFDSNQSEQLFAASSSGELRTSVRNEQSGALATSNQLRWISFED